MILYVSGRDTDELLMVLEGVRGVTVKRSQERKKRKYFEKGARKESMGQASATVFLDSAMGANELAAVRDILVQGVRCKEVEVVVKEAGDRAFAGPAADAEILVALTNALT